MVNAANADRVEKMVADAVLAGAKDALPVKRKDNIIYPTILVDPPRNTSVVTEEIFGPVAVVLGADDVEEAISIANDSNFGLQSSCFTSSLETAFKMSEELHVGSNLKKPKT